MRKSNKILIAFIFLLTLCISGFFVYTLDFYSYGLQKGDGTSLISADEQLQRTTDAIVAMIYN